MTSPADASGTTGDTTGDTTGHSDRGADAAAVPGSPSTRPGPRPGPRAPVPGPPPGAPRRPASDAASWGRVDQDGAVFVRTTDGERLVGQWPGGDPAEVLAHFARRYDALSFEIELLEQRLASGTLSPEDARTSLRQVRAAVAGAQVVGDLAALDRRLAALDELVARQREQRKAERAEQLVAAKAAKERLVTEAERLAASRDWKSGVDRMRALLEEWKALPRLEKPVDEELWRRFSGARSSYTKARRAHFAELDEKREGARAVKEKLLSQAEALSASTDWGATSGAYRDLMRRWKAAGPAPRGIEERLWKRFRAAQDAFFTARDAASAATDAEFARNAEVKEGLLGEAEALLPVTDLAAAKAALRGIAERWEAAGKVPRERVRDLESRMRAVEQAIRRAEEDAWRRSNPEARARAEATIAQLEASIADLERKRAAAAAAGDDRRVSEHDAALEARRAWLVEAQRARADFTP